MSKIIISPNKYVQGAGELSKLEKYTSVLAKKLLVIITSGGKKRFGDIIENGYKGSDSEVLFEVFNGECSKVEVERISKVCREKDIKGVIGVGGGKTLDTAKAVAHYGGVPVIIAPTIASSDAPCSALSVFYKENGEFDDYLLLPKNPNVVIMDTEIIAKSPARLTVAGMGDALATYFEARACIQSRATNAAGGTATLASYALSELCYKTLITEGYKAKVAADLSCVTPALENIIEANTLLSGLGFESSGLAGAHAIHNGFTMLEECHHLYHGEKVAFGTLVQLVIENAPLEEIEEVIFFCQSVGLPTTLKEMGIDNIKPEDIMKVAMASSVEGETIHNMSLPINEKVVYAGIMTADSLGRSYR